MQRASGGKERGHEEQHQCGREDKREREKFPEEQRTPRHRLRKSSGHSRLSARALFTPSRSAKSETQYNES